MIALAEPRQRQDMSPALLGSALLHAMVFAAFLISWPWSRELKIGTVVPVNIVSNAPSTDVRPAVEAPETQTALTEEPIPDAPLEAVQPTPEPTPPAPPPAPAPKPVPPQPAPKPAAKAAEKAPTPKAQPATKPAPKDLDFDALLAGISKSSRPSGANKSSAPKGATRAETAPQARPAVGAGISANALRGLSDELQRRWNPNCDVEGGRDVQIRVAFKLGGGGQVVGDVTADGQERSSNPVVQAAADRAIRAVHAASPFRQLPPDFYGERIIVKFNAREACS